MGKIFRRIICFLLGMIFGITASTASIAGTVYYLYGNVTVEDVANNVDGLGDLNKYSAEDIVGFLQKAMESPENYTLKDLEDKMGVDIVKLVNNIAGKDVIKEGGENDKYIDDLKTVSLFTLLTNQGFSKFVSDLPVGALLAFVPDNLISEQERAKLRRYTVGQMIAEDEYTGQKGVFSALRDISLGGILPTVFDYVDGEYVVKDKANKPLELLANVKMGAIIDSFVTKTSDIPTEIVEGGLSSIGNSTIGELLSKVVSDEKVTDQVNSLFNGMKVREMFTKNAEGKYVFAIENLTDNVRIGGVIGYTYNTADGKWYEDKEFTKPVKGILKILSSLDVTTLYLAVKDKDATTAQKVQKILNAFGDFSIGDVFETIGFEKNEADGLWYKGDTAVKSRLVSALLELSVRDVVGKGELSGKQIVQNLISALEGHFGDMTIGEGLGELFGVVKNENGEYVYTDASKGEVNALLKAAFSVKVADFFEGLANGDKFTVETLITIFKNAFAGLRVGDVAGMKYAEGKWFDKKGNEVNKYLGVVYDVELTAVFSIIENPGSVSAIVSGLLPDLTLGNLAVALLNFGSEGTGENTKYYTKADNICDETALTDGLNKILNLKIWEIVAGFDKKSDFDLLDAIGGISLGDALNFRTNEDGVWYFKNAAVGGGKAVYFPGAVATLFNFRLGDLLDPEKKASEFTEQLKDITVGEIFQSLLGMKMNEDGTTESMNGVPEQKAFDVICGCTITVRDIISSLKGDKKLNVEEELHKLFDGVRLGEFFRKSLAIEENEKGILTSAKTEKLNGVLELVYNFYCGNFITYIYNIANKKSITVDDILNDVFASPFDAYEIGDLIAPAASLTKNGETWMKDGKEIKKAVNTLLCVKVKELISELASKDSVSDKVDYVIGLVEGVGVGDVVALFAKVTKEGNDWYINEKKALPFVSNALDIDAVAVKAYAKEFKNSVKGGLFLIAQDVFETYTVGECFPSLDSKNPALDKLLATVVIDAIGYELDIAGYTDKTFPEVTGVKKVDYLLSLLGEVTIGDIANKTSTKAALADLYAIRTGDILGIVGNVVKAKGTTASLKQAAFDLVNLYAHDYTFARYLKSNGNAALDTLLNTKPLDIAGYELDIAGYTDKTFPEVTGVKKVDYLLDIFGNVTIGDIANKTSEKLLLSDLYAIRTGDVLSIVGTVVKAKGAKASLQKGVYDLVNLYAKDRTAYDYATDWTKKEITVDGLKVFLENLRLTEFAGVMSGYLDAYSLPMKVENFLGVGRADYMLQIADAVKIGDFFKDYTYNGSKWEKNGTEAKDLTNAVLSISGRTVIIAVCALFMPDKVLEMYGDDKLGSFLAKPYNNAFGNTFTTEATGDKETGYTVTGSFKTMAETVFNLTANDIVDQIRNKTVKSWVYNTFGDWTVRDVSYDLLKKCVPAKAGITFNGFAGENLEVTGTMAPVLNAAFPVTAKTIWATLKNKSYYTFVIDTFGEIKFGDFVKDYETKTYKVVVKDALELKANEVLPIVRDVIKAKGSKESLKQGMFDLVYAIAGEAPLSRYFKNDNEALKKALATQVIEIAGVEIGIGEYNEIPVTSVVGVRRIDYLLGLLSDATIGEALNKTSDKNAIADLYAMKIGTLLEVTGNVVKEKATTASLKQGAYDLTEAYAGDYLLSRYFRSENAGVRTVLESAKVKEIAGVELGIAAYDNVEVKSVLGKKKVDYLLRLFGDVSIADLTGIKSEKALVKDTAALKGEILLDSVAVLKADKNNAKKVTYNVVKEIASDHTVYYYFNDWTGKKFSADGMNVLLDNVKIAEFTGVMLGQIDAYEDLSVKDFAGNGKVDYVLQIADAVKVGNFVKDYVYDETSDKWSKNGTEAKSYVNTVMNVTGKQVAIGVYALLNPQKVVDKYGDRKLGRVFAKPYNEILSSKLNSEVTGDSVNGYTVTGNFKKAAEVLMNTTVSTAYDAVKGGASGIKSYISDNYMTLKVGDYTYDVMRKYLSSKLGLNLTGYAYEAVDAEGNYNATANFKAILDESLNITVREAYDAVKGGTSTVKSFVKAHYFDLTVGDYTYDIFRKYVASKVRLTAEGYAYEGYNVTGKLQKAAKATFAIKAGDVYDLLRNRKVYDFVIAHYGELTLGDFGGAIFDKLLASKLKVTISYAEDYTPSATDGNFKEVINIGFAINAGEFAQAMKDKTYKSFLLGENGVFSAVPFGNVAGYLTKKTFEKKGTNFDRGEDGSWVITGAYAKPLDIAFNDITLRALVRSRTDLKNGIVLPYFGEIRLGEMLGGYADDDGNWHKSNGDLVATEGGKAAIMNNAYGLKVSEVLADDFSGDEIFEGLYLGEVIGYNAEAHEGYCAPGCKLNESDPSHSHKFYWVGTDGKFVGTLLANLADKPLTDVMNGSLDLDEIIGEAILGDVIDITDASPIALRSLKDTKIKELETRFNNLKLGEVLDISTSGENESPKILQLLADTKITELGSAMNELYLGSVMGYEKGEDGKWYDDKGAVATNMMAVLADYKVKDLNGDFSSTLLEKIKSTLTVTDVFGEVKENSPLSLLDPDMRIGDLPTEFGNAMKKSSFDDLIRVGVLTENMFDETTPLGLLKSNTKTDAYYDDGLKAVTLSNIQEKLSEVINNATVEQLMKAGIVPDSYADKLTVTMVAGKKLASARAGKFGDAVKAKAEKAAGEEDFWKSLTLDELFNVLLTNDIV